MTNNFSMLHNAAQHGCLETVLALVDGGEFIDAQTDCGDTPLLLAAKESRKDIVECLINAGAGINFSGSWFNYTVLHFASFNGWLEIVENLLQKGVDVDAKTKCGDTALLLAAKKSHASIVKLLVDAGAGIEFSDSRNYTVLHHASEHGWLGIVRTLLGIGADIQVRTESGDSPLLIAAKKNCRGVFTLLFNAGADCSDALSNAVMLCAVENGWLEVVQILLLQGVDVETKTECGDTLLLLAAEKEHTDIVKLLINAGANINCSGKYFRYTVLHFASLYGWPEIVQLLLRKGADIDVMNSYGVVPLFLAAQNSHKVITKYLIDAGANIWCIDPRDRTLLYFASRNGWLDIVQLLLAKGIYFEIVENGYGDKCLLQAAENGHKEIVNLLIDAGANIRCSDSRKCTVLHYASEFGWLEIVHFLLKMGADFEVETVHGDTPLLLAAQQRHRSLTKYLVDAGSNIERSDHRNYTVLHYATENGWSEIVLSLLKRGINIEEESCFGKTSLHLACDYSNLEIVQLLVNAGANVNVQCQCGNSPLSGLIKESTDVKPITFLLKSGAYLKSSDYKGIAGNSLLKKYILQDIELSSQCIINEFNHKHLPELYELSMTRKSLPRIEKIRIRNKSQAACEVLMSVEREIQEKGHCNVLEVRPIVLQMLCVKSLIAYCD